MNKQCICGPISVQGRCPSLYSRKLMHVWIDNTLSLCRVKDLESLQNQVAQNHGKELVDEQALEEMELLRQRVMQLEGEASSRDGPAPPGQGEPDAALADLNAELMQEMEDVRRRVMQLQVLQLKCSDLHNRQAAHPSCYSTWSLQGLNCHNITCCCSQGAVQHLLSSGS